MRTTANVQEAFLNLCRKESTRCIIYLVNGVQLRGVVKGFDTFTILMEDEGRQQIIYKHAVTTVQPMRRIPTVQPLTSDLPDESEEAPVEEAEA